MDRVLFYNSSKYTSIPRILPFICDIKVGKGKENICYQIYQVDDY